MDTSIVGQIAALRRMSASELRAEWLRVHGEPTRSSNPQFLFKRLAWEVQARAHGGLSNRARRRIEELAPVIQDRHVVPAQAVRDADPAPPAQRNKPSRDPRLPVAGSVISKQYKGRELRVTVRDDGYEYDGAMFASLTAVAKHATGSKSINGKLFFGLTQRKRT